MGTQWGINRTVAQIHALLYLAPRPLNAEEIANTLSVARSNVSTSLWELQGWGVIKTVHVLGDRRDHYQTLSDVWEMFRLILEERKKREIDPTLGILRECVHEAQKSKAESENAQKLGALLDFFETMSSCYDQLKGVPVEEVAKIAHSGGKWVRWLGLKSDKN
jgi:DNA-binding transcriptional regulator GbsR (MarR family)